MNITFYTTSDPPKKLNKTITPIGTAKALTPTAQIDVLNPVVVINYDSTYVDQIINANYAYIDTFHRYYFIKCSIDTAKRIIVSGTVDYLMSWKDGILNCPATITRADLGAPTYVTDNKYPIHESKFIFEGIDFDTAPDFYSGSEHYVIITR